MTTNSVLHRAVDHGLTELIDAAVAAVDTDRAWEVERLRTALEPYDPTGLFAEELRLNGTPSLRACECCGEGWL